MNAAPGRLRGAIVDSEGAAFADAYVLIRQDIAGKIGTVRMPDRPVTPDRRGTFDIPLDAGFYDVCVLADAFTPTCRKVAVRDAGTATARFRLVVDPQVIKIIGDIVPTR